MHLVSAGVRRRRDRPLLDRRSTVAAYLLMFLLMTWNAQRLFPVPYQWRRMLTLVAVAVALTVAGKVEHVALFVAVALIAIYPIVLLALGFYLPAERRRIRRIVPLFR